MSTYKWITIDEDFVHVADYENPHAPNNKLSMGWHRPDFETQFNLILPQNIKTINYEPEKNLFCVVERPDNITSYTNPDDNVHLKWCKDNIDSIIHIATGMMLTNHVYDETQDIWYIPAAVQTELDRQAEVNRLKSESREHDRFLFRMILELFQVGKDKGVWTNTDFDTVLRQKLVDVKAKLDELDTIDPVT